MTLEVQRAAATAGWPVWEALGCELDRELPVRAVTTILHEAQHRLLEDVCGPRWQPRQGAAAPLACPRCDAGEDFARKGRRGRLRRLETAFGTIMVRLANVRCRGCSRVFAPLIELLRLRQVRRSDRLTLALTELATQMSYGRARPSRAS